MASDAPSASLPAQPRVGETFTSESRPVTESDIVSFARQTGDLHPVHLDSEYAAETPFGERVAPGALTLSYTLGLLRLDPGRVIALRGITDVVFTRPVKVDDTLAVKGRVASVAPGDGGIGTVAFTLATLNQDRKLVCRSRVQVLWRGDFESPGKPRDG
jgi:acyl dehydratase